MASIWKINGADIYVDKYNPSVNPSIAELNPINSTSSTFHYMFTPSTTVTIAGTVIGASNLSTIQGGAGGNVTLISDLDPGGSTVLLVNVEAERKNVYKQLVDLSQADDAPVYNVTCTIRL